METLQRRVFAAESSISKTSEVTTNGCRGETVTTGCWVLQPLPRTRRGWSSVLITWLDITQVAQEWKLYYQFWFLLAYVTEFSENSFTAYEKCDIISSIIYKPKRSLQTEICEFCCYRPARFPTSVLHWIKCDNELQKSIFLCRVYVQDRAFQWLLIYITQYTYWRETLQNWFIA